MGRVTILLRQFRMERTDKLWLAVHKRTSPIANRLIRQMRSEHHGDLSSGQKGAITRKAWKTAEAETQAFRQKRLAQLEVEVETERQRLIMLHCPPDTSEGLAARAVNEARQREQQKRQEIERAKRIHAREERAKARQIALAQRRAEREADDERRSAEAVARRQADPPIPRFAPGSEPLGWKPFMNKGEMHETFSPVDTNLFSLPCWCDADGIISWPDDPIWDDLPVGEDEGVEAALQCLPKPRFAIPPSA